jgi:hypothetical protein
MIVHQTITAGLSDVNRLRPNLRASMETERFGGFLETECDAAFVEVRASRPHRLQSLIFGLQKATAQCVSSLASTTLAQSNTNLSQEI